MNNMYQSFFGSTPKNPKELTMRTAPVAVSGSFNFPKLKWSGSVITILLVFMTSISLSAQITGTVFRDYNGNGIQEGGEPGRGDIIVKAYANATLPAKDQLVATATTNASGQYTMNPPQYPVRLEFEIPDGLCNMASNQDFAASDGDTYGTAVQFADGPGVYNFIIMYPFDFSTDQNPPTFLTVYGNGDPLNLAGDVKDLAGVVKFNYRNSGYASNSGRGNNSGAPWEMVARQEQVGATYGVAISRQAKKVWVSAVVRRHAGMGPEGSGGIYWMDVDPPYDLNANLKFVNFDTDLGIPTSDQVNPYTDALTGSCSNEVYFSPVLGTNTERGLPGDRTQPSADPAAWDQVGKLAFGDMDISEDGQYLYVVNLYDRKLYQIDLQDPFDPQVPTAANVKGFDIPSPCGGDGTPTGQHRPYGLKVKRGIVYVGVVCSAQNEDGTVTGGDASDMTGNIFEFYPDSETWSGLPVVDWTFEYRDGDRPWLPWRADFWIDGYEVNGTPLISDIEFDANGNFLIGVMDRHGSQGGHRNADLCGSCCGDNLAMVGELLQAVRDPNSPTCQYSIQLNPEYYDDNYIHTESSMGALSVHFTAEFDGALSTFMDPIGIYSSGVMLYDNLTGDRVATQNAQGGNTEGYEVIYSSSSNEGYFGKANSLGDLETLEIIPPLEIGNLVWIDLDRDGIQDGDELPVPGVDVELLDENGNLVATTTTGPNGGFYFNYSNVDENDHTLPVSVPGLLGPQPNTNYILRINSAHFNNSNGFGPLAGTLMTLSNESVNGLSEYSDNDAVDVLGLAEISFTTGGIGETNHTYDFGFYLCPTVTGLYTDPEPSVCSDNTFDVDITHDPDIGPMQLRYNVGATLTAAQLYGGMGTLLQGSILPPGAAATSTTVSALSLTPNLTGAPITYNLYALRDPSNPNYDDEACHTVYSTTIVVNPETSEATVTTTAEVCDRPDGPTPHTIDLMTLVTGGDTNGAWEDTDGSGGLVGSVFTANTTMTGNSYTFTYRLTGTGPVGTNCEDNTYETVVTVADCGMDLALRKTTDQIVVPAGGDVTFDIEIFNQGSVTAGDITIVDYIPVGFDFIPADNPGWTAPVGNKVYYTIANSNLEETESTIIQIVLKAKPTAQPGDFVNEAEVFEVKNVAGDIMSDMDSTPDDDPDNDNNVQPGDPDDDEIDEDGSPGQDEDDNDVADVKIFDLALVKEMVSTGPFVYGDLVEFQITIINQGEVPAQNVEITDYVPAGFVYTSANNPGWSGVATMPHTTITSVIAPGSSASVSIFLELVPSNEDDAWINTAEISGAEDDSGHDMRGLDWDSQNDNTPNNDAGGAVGSGSDNSTGGNGSGDPGDPDPITDEDDSDPAIAAVSDLALRKILLTSATPFYGNDLVFNIEVFNQGNTDAANIVINDYIPSGYVFNGGDNPGWSGAAPTVSFTITGPIAPGDSESIQIVLELAPGTSPADWDNYAEIASFTDGLGNPATDADSNPNSDAPHERAVTPGDADDNNIDGHYLMDGTDEDDHDPAAPRVFDLALTKVLSSTGPFKYGDLVDFTITIYNQGNVTAQNIELVDYVPDGFEFFTADNTGWFGVNPTPITNLAVTLAPAESTTKTISLRLKASDLDGAWVNYAEIIASEDEGGNDMSNKDADSPYDQIQNNDAGGSPGTGSDDSIDGDGSGSPLDTDPATDEDDHDPALVDVFDLALRKTLLTPPPYNYGGDLVFQIEVFNQGNITATNVEIKDYLNAGFVFNGGDNPDWSPLTPAPVVAAILPGPIVPGGSETITLTLELAQGSTSDDWDNYAEISAAQDDTGADMTLADADSTPDTDAAHERAVKPGDIDDDNINGYFIPDGTDEDDHDPAAPDIFDLALTKVVTSPAPYRYGDVVDFTITVYNQGNIPATDIDIIDYVPAGFTYDFTLNPGWSNFSTSVPKRTITSVLNPATSTTVQIRLIVENGTAADRYLNYAEITKAYDPSGNNMTNLDVDSTPDEVKTNDAGGQVNSGSDDSIVGLGTGANGDTDPFTDEDDHDPAQIEVFDLALTKKLLTSKPYGYGQNLTFEIEVFNQGTITATDIEVNDYVPDGFVFNGGDNPGWSGVAPTVSYTISGPLAPGASTTISIVLELAQGSNELSWDNYAEIASALDETGGPVVDADSNPGSDAAHERAVRPGDIDDDNISGHFIPDGTDEDDHDPAGPEIFDLALNKTTVETPPFRIGDLIEFNVRVCNQGNETADEINIVDYVPAGFTFDFAANLPVWNYDNNSRIANTWIRQPLAPFECRDISIELRVSASPDNEDGWTNRAEIFSTENAFGQDYSSEDVDSSPDNDPANDAGGLADSPADDYMDGVGTGVPGDGVAATDEDDADPERIEIFDLALRKTLITSGPYKLGNNVTFEIEVFNQGNLTATNIVVNDYIPDGYVYNPGDNPGWVGGAPTVNYTIAGPLAPGESQVISITLELDQGTNQLSWDNYAEIAAAQDETGADRTTWDADSTPASDAAHERAVRQDDPDDNNIDGHFVPNGTDEDDHDPAAPKIFDLALNKTTLASGPFAVGDLVDFEIQVCNQGNVTANEIRVIDYVPSGFGYDHGMNFPTWNYDALSGNADTRYSSPLAPGECITIPLTLIVQYSGDYEFAWTNRAEIFSAQNQAGQNMNGHDLDSTPDNNPSNDAGDVPESPADDYLEGDGTGVPGDGVAETDEDDADPERIEIFDLALRKELLTTTTPYRYGQELEFEITVFNQGNEPATDVFITEYIPAGYSFNLADNPGWNGVYPNPYFVIPGPIDPATSQSFTIKLVIEQTTGGEKDWINYAEITSASDEDGNLRNNWDIDSEPATDGPGERAVEPGDPADDNINSHDKGGEEDDHDPAGIEVMDLAQRKVIANQTGPYQYGETVTFTFEVYNQGSIETSGIEITDYIPCGFTYLSSNDANGWSYNDVTGMARVILPGSLAPGASTTITIDLEITQCLDDDPDTFTNYGEISDYTSEDPDYPDPEDIDSMTDDDPNNDTGGTPDDPNEDNNIEGDKYQDEDEDDHDPERIEVFDLALKKELITLPNPAYRYGDELEFRFTLCNQGNVDAQNVVVTDYIPEGYSLSPHPGNSAWTAVGPNYTYDVGGVLAQDQCLQFTIWLTIEQTDGGEKDWINYAEITFSEDTEGATRVDADSNEGSDGPGERAVEPGDAADDDMESTDKGGEEDDHDPAGIEVLDLAQRKVIANQTGPYQYGETVTFTFEVYNQGSIETSGIEITDYIPCGFIYLASNDANGWSYNDVTGMARVTLPGSLAPGASTTITIDLEITQCLDDDPDTFTNYGEISDYTSEDPDYPDPEDIDSMTDDDPNNDTGGTPDDPNEDNNIEGDKYQDEDEDDHDPERIEVFDLALKKELLTQPNPTYRYGDELEFSITVYNQGNVDADNIVLTDYLPDGYSLSANPANTGWTPVGDNLEFALPDPLLQDEEITISLFLIIEQTDGGEKDWINYVEITASTDLAGTPRVDADSNEGSDGLDERAVEPDDPADDDIESTDKGGEEDDHDPAGIEVLDLAQRKVVDNRFGPYEYGDVVTFTFEVYNQGSIQTSEIEITDYIPCGFKYLASNDAIGWTYDELTGKAKVILPVNLIPGESTTYTIDLEVQQCLDINPNTFTNFSEISDFSSDDPDYPDPEDIDSMTDDDPNNDSGGTPDDPNEDDNVDGDKYQDEDEDDHDPERIEVFDLALRKVLVQDCTTGDCVTANQIGAFGNGFTAFETIDGKNYDTGTIGFYVTYDYTGATQVTKQVTFNISNNLTVEHVLATAEYMEISSTGTPGEIKLVVESDETTVNIGLHESLVYTYSVTDNGGSFTLNYDIKTSNQAVVLSGSHSIAGPIDAEAFTFVYEYITNVDDANDFARVNGSVNSSWTGCEVVDCAVVEPYRYGDELHFTLEVFNQGNVAAQNIEITDYLPEGYSLSPNPANAIWTANAGNFSTVLPGILPADAKRTLDIYLIIEQTDGGEKDWINYAEITNSTDTEGGDRVDADSNEGSDGPDERAVEPDDPADDDIESTDKYGEEDDHDPAGIEVFDLAQRKVIPNQYGPYEYGDIATFTFEVFNQGSIEASGIEVTDYIPCGFKYLASNDASGWSYNEITGVAKVILPGNLIPGEMTTITIDLEVQQCLDVDPNTFTNFGEISDFVSNDPDYPDPEDIDSMTDDDPNNDNGGTPDDPNEDDNVDGDKYQDEDEDDHDPERIEVFDLALKKELLTQPNPEYRYGDELEFSITVYNQGNVDADNIVLTDYLPEGYSLSANPANAGWSTVGNNLEYTLPDPLLQDQNVNVRLYLIIEQTDGGEKDWINYVEVTYSTDLLGDPRVDADSNEGSDGTDERTVEPDDPADDDIESTDKGGEEDDHDPAGIEVFDLAQRKVIANQFGPYEYGDVATFTFEVYNQGSIEASGIEITDYIPCGFKYLASNDANGWVYDEVTGMAKVVLPGNLAAGASTTYTIDLEVQQCLDDDPNTFTNFGEVSDFESEDPDYPDPEDIDSMTDDDPNNDNGGTPDDPNEDDNVDGDKYQDEDEDDHDPERIEVFDLALKKELLTQANPQYRYGDELEFSITVYNQGNVDAQNIVLTDYLPSGYSLSANPANAGWTPVGDNLEYALPDPLLQDQNVTVSLFLIIEQTDGGEKDWINYVEITGSTDLDDIVRVDADSNEGSDGAGERAVEPGDAADDDIESTDKGGEEDDHDPAGIEVFDLAQRKVIANQTGPYEYGDVATFTFEVYNQGSIEASGIEITDYIPCGFKYLASNDANGWVYDDVSGMAKVILPGTLIPGTSTNFTIDLEVQQCIDTDPNSFTNFGEISDFESEDPDYPDPEDIDSMTDDDPNNDNGGTPDDPNEDDNIEGDKYQDEDEDDHDPERIEVFDLALKKELLTPDTPPYEYGAELEFSITVCNQGNVDAHNVVVTDYLPGGYSLSGNPANAGWTPVGANLEYALPNPLLEDECVTFYLYLIIERTSGGEKDWINYAEITASTDPAGDPRVDADSNEGSNGPGEQAVEPGDPADNDLESTDKGGEEDDHDPAGIEVFDLAMFKTTNATGPFYYGQEITFDINVLNQGSREAQNIEIHDYIPDGYEFVQAQNPQWTYDPVSGNASTIISDPLVPGASTTVQITLVIVQAYEPTAWDNYAEIVYAENENGDSSLGDDFDSVADSNADNDNGGEPGTDDDDEINEDGLNNQDEDEDDHDGERIEIFDLALKNVVEDRGPFAIGEIAMFNLTIYNQGNEPATNIVVADYKEPGFNWDGTLNPGWSFDGTKATYTIPGPLAPGESVEISVKWEIILSATPQPEDWYNWAEIQSAANAEEEDRTGADADSTPATDAPHERAVIPDHPDDNNVLGDYKNKGEDEDDHDPDKVIVVGGLGDYVWLDLDADGIQDPNESGVEGVIAILQDCNGAEIATTTTDATGFYFFDNLIPGDYNVVMDGTSVPENLWWTYQDMGGDDELDSDVDFFGVMDCTNISGGEYDSTWDAGLLLLSKLGDYVWHDIDGDGIQDLDEPGIEGVEVILHDCNGAILETTYTDINGYYLFDRLYPGEYYVEFVTPDGFTDVTLDNVGPDDSVDSDVNHANGYGTTPCVTLVPGTELYTLDAGYYVCATIGELVWCDYNFNDVWDPEENGINGLLVNVWKFHGGEWILWDYTYTGHKPGTPSDDGWWQMCVIPGTYYVEIPIPPYGLVQTIPNVGDDEFADSDLEDAFGFGTTTSFSLISGEEKLDIGGGFYNMATMGDRVWLDQNYDGMQDPSEPGVPGVVVKAFTIDNVLMGETTTDENGQFNVDYLRKNAHYLEFNPPANYGFTIDNYGGDEIDSDVDGMNGFGTTANYPLEPGMHKDLDAGLILGTLPLELTDFWGENRVNFNFLEWATEREFNSEMFTIERRFENEESFTKIAEVKAAGVSLDPNQYELKDFNIEKDGVYYYKLQQINKDGKSTFSEIVAIVVDRSENADIRLYPNPARDRFEIELGLIEENHVRVDILDAQGKLARVALVDSKLTTGFYKQVIEIENLAEGVYTVQIQIGEEITNKKLVVLK